MCSTQCPERRHQFLALQFTDYDNATNWWEAINKLLFINTDFECDNNEAHSGLLVRHYARTTMVQLETSSAESGDRRKH
jgi:hypothetical protein